MISIDFVVLFLHDALYPGVSQRIQNIILHKILNVYPLINSNNKGGKLSGNLMCDSTRQNSFGLE